MSFLMIRSLGLAVVLASTSPLLFIAFYIAGMEPYYGHLLDHHLLFVIVAITIFFLIGLCLYILTQNNISYEKGLQ